MLVLSKTMILALCISSFVFFPHITQKSETIFMLVKLKPAQPKWSRESRDAQVLSREINIGSSQERSALLFSFSLWTVLLFIWPEEQKDLNCLQRALEDCNSNYWRLSVLQSRRNTDKALFRKPPARRGSASRHWPYRRLGESQKTLLEKSKRDDIIRLLLITSFW